MIEVNERIDVPSAPQAVWDLLTDPRAVVDCVPGATLGEQHEDGSFDGGLTVKFGPAKVTFLTRVSLELDAAAKTGHVTARGRDNQGGTRVRAKMTFKVVEQTDAPGTSILIEAEVEITGRLALVVEAGAGLVVKRMTREFSERLAARCTGGAPAAASTQ
jgi:carbon monoxide dehydrogenase subunit G